MGKGNKLEVLMSFKTQDSPLNRISEKLKKITGIGGKLEQKLNKLTYKMNTKGVDKLNNAIIKTAGIVNRTGNLFNNIKRRIERSFPVRQLVLFKSSVSKVVTTMKAQLGPAFNQIKSKVLNSFPVRAVNKLREKLKSLKDKAKDTGKGFSFLKGKIGSLIGMAAGIVSIGAAFSFVNSSIEDYKADMINATKLKSNIQIVQAYKNDPTTMNKVFQEFQSEASRIQGIGVFGDEMIVGAQAQLSTFQLSNKEINMLMPKIADIVANQKGMNGTAEDFFGTANMIGKAMSTGMLAPLRKVGIALTDAEMKQFKTLNQTQRAAKLQEILSKNVGNINEELAKTPLGKIKQAENAWGDMKEKIGEAAVNVKGKFAPYILQAIPIVEKLGTKIIDSVGQGIDYVIANSGKITGAFKTVFNGIDLKGLSSGMLSALGGFYNAIDFSGIFSGINEIFKGIMSGIDMGQISKIFSDIGNAVSVFYKTLDFKMIGNAIGTVFRVILKLVSTLSPYLAPIMQMIASIVNLVMQIIPGLEPIALVIIQIAGMLLSMLMPAVQFIVNGFVVGFSFVTMVLHGISAVVSSVLMIIIGIVSGFVSAVQTIFSLIGSFVQLVLTGVVGLFTGNFDAVQNVVKTAIDKIKGFFDGIVNKAKDVGKAIADAFKIKMPDWMNKGVAAIGNFVKGRYIGDRSWEGGPVTVAEKGPELITPPNAKPFMIPNQMTLDLPQGTAIDTAESTRRMVNKMGSANEKLSSKGTTSVKKESGGTKKVVFSPVFHIYNSDKNEENIESQINRVLNKFFEEKLIGMGG